MSLGAFFNKARTPLLKLLVFLLPTQLGYHFWPAWAYVFGIRIDYLSPTIYLTDLVVGLLAFGWLLNSKTRTKKNAILVLAVLGSLAFINSFYALLPMPAVYKWVKVTELIFVSHLVYKEQKLAVIKTIATPLAISLVFVFALSLLQLLFQRSIGGALYFLGERTFNSGTPGISLYSVFGSALLRPYSTFSHPNSMAGFAGVSFILLAGAYLGLKRKSVTLSIGTVTSLAALILSGSKAAIVGILFAVGSYYLTRKRKELFHKVLVTSIIFTVLASLLLPVVADRLLQGKIIFSERVSQRLVLAELAGRAFSKAPVVGLGLNNFIPNVAGLKVVDNFSWVLQPVHNLHLLVLTEAGIVIFIFWIWLIFRLVKTIKSKSTIFGPIVIFILITASVDHYWFTLQQNQLLLAVLVGLMLRKHQKDFLLN